jgi:chaperonin cofactor prefoldin
MLDHPDDSHEKHSEDSFTPNQMLGLAATIVVLIIIAAAGAIYGFRQQSTVSQLTTRNSMLDSNISHMQDQISTLTSQLNQLAASQSAAQAAAAAQPAATHPAEAHVAHHRSGPSASTRMKQMQTQIADLSKQLKDTQDTVAQQRSDLENNIDSTRDQLNGSIARTHDELVALEQKGERNYYEFDLNKSKDFQRSGPISVMLRKADTKHRSYDMMLLVDDNRLSKKKVDLYEPIWITGDDGSQLQIVVNKIDKDHVHGYVSAPKYPAQARLVTTSTAASNASPAVANTPASNSTGATTAAPASTNP